MNTQNAEKITDLPAVRIVVEISFVHIALFTFFTIAADEQQSEVDTERKSEHRDDIQDENGQVHFSTENRQYTKRGYDSHNTNN